MKDQKQFLTIVMAIIATALIVGGGMYWLQTKQKIEKNVIQPNSENEKINEIQENIEVETPKTEKQTLSPLTKTHTNRLFTINYPEDWRTITNESGGLMEIRQPTNDHAIINITYIDARFDDISRCVLNSRNWLELSFTTLEETNYSKLIRYEGKDKFQQPEIAFVAVSGTNDAIHDCTIIDFEDAWASDKEMAWKIIESVKLRK